MKRVPNTESIYGTPCRVNITGPCKASKRNINLKTRRFKDKSWFIKLREPWNIACSVEGRNS